MVKRAENERRFTTAGSGGSPPIEADTRLAFTLHDLAEAYEELEAAADDLATTNAELRAANEELEARYRELRARADGPLSSSSRR